VVDLTGSDAPECGAVVFLIVFAGRAWSVLRWYVLDRATPE
jgi:hypothetical protein